MVPTSSLPTHAQISAKTLFFDLFDGQFRPEDLERAADFLCLQLESAAHLDSDLPATPDELVAWMEGNVEEVGAQYRRYLDARKNGARRRYFSTKSHALYFLQNVAPTKLVDGAWLYGLLHHWRDARFGNLVKTYLEELGEGLPAKNHVVLYRKLLSSQGLEHWDDLSDAHFVQGAIQLALAYHADRFLPEVIGFNLGYEQLPLHLLITSYELKELGIDPYYFTLHVTVDNADSGHARKAVDAIFEALPRVGDQNEWLRRVRNGYNLNFLGKGTTCVVSEFDLDAEIIAIFRRKGTVGQFAHSDYRQVEGRGVNSWLSQPDQTPKLIAAMERAGWFQRHQNPQNSRFWRLIEGQKAKMFGVFNAYEKQVIWDWIAGDWDAQAVPGARPLVSFETRHKLAETERFTLPGEGDFDAEVRALQHDLAAAKDAETHMARLIELMSPALHHSTAGLMATRIFNDVLG